MILPPAVRSPRFGALAALLGALVASGCNTQRFPGPMAPLVRPLPEGDIPAGPYGPQEVVVYRLSDPVLVRRAGEAAAYPLPVYNKRERVRSGASVQCAAGGRCELLWPQDASSVLLYDEGWVDLGEPSRDEPIVTFRRLTRARLVLTPEDSVVLMGGATLRGDTEDKSGPFLVERTRDDLVTLTNQSKRACTVGFRDTEIVLSPGELLRLPLLDAGGEPAPRDPSEALAEVRGREVRMVGNLTVEGGSVRAGSGGGTFEDGGVIVTLTEGESALLEVYAAPVAVPGPEALEGASEEPASEVGESAEVPLEPSVGTGTPAEEPPAQPPPAPEPDAEAGAADPVEGDAPGESAEESPDGDSGTNSSDDSVPSEAESPPEAPGSDPEDSDPEDSDPEGSGSEGSGSEGSDSEGSDSEGSGPEDSDPDSPQVPTTA